MQEINLFSLALGLLHVGTFWNPAFEELCSQDQHVCGSWIPLELTEEMVFKYLSLKTVNCLILICLLLE